MIIACAGCHLHWLAVVLLPVALWVFKIFRHKGKKCPCDCHKEEGRNNSLRRKSIEEIEKENLELIEKIQPKK